MAGIFLSSFIYVVLFVALLVLYIPLKALIRRKRG
jgi:hypothetical protein